MKSALCLYGHFRSFKDCWPNLQKYLLEPNQIQDIFAVAWVDSMGHFQHPGNTSSPLTHVGYDPSSPGVAPDYVANVLSTLRPRAFHFENYYTHDKEFEGLVYELQAFHHPSKDHRPKGTLGQVYGRCMSLQLARRYEETHGFRYDGMVCTRWDIDYTKPIDLAGLGTNTMTMDGMYGPDVISDAWAFGPSWAIERWATQFLGMERLCHLGTMNTGPHEWLRAHFDAAEIPWHNDPNLGIYIRR
jgi:hypothetical protein